MLQVVYGLYDNTEIISHQMKWKYGHIWCEWVTTFILKWGLTIAETIAWLKTMLYYSNKSRPWLLPFQAQDQYHQHTELNITDKSVIEICLQKQLSWHFHIFT